MAAGWLSRRRTRRRLRPAVRPARQPAERERRESGRGGTREHEQARIGGGDPLGHHDGHRPHGERRRRGPGQVPPGRGRLAAGQARALRPGELALARQSSRSSRPQPSPASWAAAGSAFATPSILGADELVEPRHRPAPRHRDRIAPGVTPRHPELIQRLTAQSENIRGLVCEQISRILVPVVAICKLCPYSVYPAITIRMEQPAGKSAGIFRDNDALPCLQLDFPHVLAARAVLREKARPMPRTTDNFRAADLLLSTDLVAWQYGAHDPFAFAPEPRP